jgi:type IV pilus assembly protein PilM
MVKFLDLKVEMFGIDISDSAVKVLKLKKKRNFFKVDFISEVEIEPGIVEAGVIKNEDLLAKIIKKSVISKIGKKLNTKYAVVGLPEEKSFLEVIQMPIMKEEELKSAVLFQAENYIPMLLEQVYLDFQVVDNNKKEDDHLDVLIVAMPKTTIDSYLSCFKKADLIPVVLEVESQAIARALIKNESSSVPLILINYGKKNSNIIIFSGKSIRFTSSVPISSSQITEAIAKGLAVSLEEAEKMKVGFSLLKKDESEESKKIYSAIYPVLSDLIFQIKKYLIFYKDHVSHDHSLNKKNILNNISITDKNNVKDDKITNSVENTLYSSGQEKIIITGGGSNLKGLAEFISKEILIETEIGNVFSNLTFKNEKNNLIKEEKKSSFCTAIGLALRATNENS